eukprot:jgi/Bigna1/90973/estExt_fgenesh1_pg.C_840049
MLVAALRSQSKGRPSAIPFVQTVALILLLVYSSPLVEEGAGQRLQMKSRVYKRASLHQLLLYRGGGRLEGGQNERQGWDDLQKSGELPPIMKVFPEAKNLPSRPDDAEIKEEDEGVWRVGDQQDVWSSEAGTNDGENLPSSEERHIERLSKTRRMKYSLTESRRYLVNGEGQEESLLYPDHLDKQRRESQRYTAFECLQNAEAHKMDGNKLFRDGNYANAAREYQLGVVWVCGFARNAASAQNATRWDCDDGADDATLASTMLSRCEYTCNALRLNAAFCYIKSAQSCDCYIGQGRHLKEARKFVDLALREVLRFASNAVITTDVTSAHAPPPIPPPEALIDRVMAYQTTLPQDGEGGGCARNDDQEKGEEALERKEEEEEEGEEEGEDTREIFMWIASLSLKEEWGSLLRKALQRKTELILLEVDGNPVAARFYSKLGLVLSAKDQKLLDLLAKANELIKMEKVLLPG